MFFYLLFNDFYKKSYKKPVAIKTSAKKNYNDEAAVQLTNGCAKSESCALETQLNGNCEDNNNNNFNNGPVADNKKTE